MRVKRELTGRSIGQIVAEAGRAEDLGYEGVIAHEAGHDPFLPLLVAAEHSQRLTLSTGVAIAFPRSPFVTAQLAWDLQSFSRGRFLLGLGTQVKGHNERRYSTPWTGPPGPRLREYITCLRAIFKAFQNGTRPNFVGQHYQFTLIVPFFNPGAIDHPDIPIYVSAVNKYITRLAGELCQGVHLHPFTTLKYTREVLLPNLEAGTRKTGRQLLDIDLVGSPFVACGKNEEEIEKAKLTVKQRIAFYGSTRTYLPVLETHGWGETGLRLHRLSVEGKWEEMTGLISDDMMDAFAIVGTYDEIVPKLRERWNDTLSSLSFDLPADTPTEEERLKAMVQALKAD